MKMILRSSIWPRSIRDGLATIFILFMIPVIYWFEIFIVLPTFYEAWSFCYIFHVMTGTYILITAVSNFVAIVICDTSIKGRFLPASPSVNWRFCSTCESVTPPRSWHCKICNICILKRDHHCMFSACCIGHGNHRYFLMFVLHSFVATLYATCYNVVFITHYVQFGTWLTYIRIIFPLAMVFAEFTVDQAYLFLVMLVVIGCAFTGGLTYYHTDLMLRGIITDERNNKLSEYDLGRQENIKQVLGEKWYLVWISPFIHSELPHDGINWETKNSFKGR